MDWNTITELARILAWPAVVAAALFAFRKPLAAFLSGLSGRLAKLSVFNVSIELAALPDPPAPWTDPVLPQSSAMMGGEVHSTTLSGLFAPIGAEQNWDYLIVDVQDGRFWLVSRVFVFTVFLQAMRNLKCVVFVQTLSKHRRELLGLASPEAVRTALAQAFPWLEKALASAIAQHAPHLLAPALPATTAGEMMRAFIADRDMRLLCDPAEMIKPSNNCQVPENQRPTDPIRLEDWTPLKDEGGNTFWEHTHWLDLDVRRVGDAVTRSFYDWDASHYVEAPDAANEERVRALLRRRTPYIALVNSRGEFKALIDRQKLAALAGEASVKL